MDVFKTRCRLISRPNSACLGRGGSWHLMRLYLIVSKISPRAKVCTLADALEKLLQPLHNFTKNSPGLVHEQAKAADTSFGAISMSTQLRWREAILGGVLTEWWVGLKPSMRTGAPSWRGSCTGSFWVCFSIATILLSRESMQSPSAILWPWCAVESVCAGMGS